MELNIEDALAIRKALEPETYKMVADEKEAEVAHHNAMLINQTSMAISLRRIAGALEKQNRLIETLTKVHQTKR